MNNSQNKKITPISLYLKDLKRQSIKSNIYDFKIASIKYKSLSVKERDYYEVQAKKMNQKSGPVVFTTQKDTLGNSLKEVDEKAKRRDNWLRTAPKVISSICQSRTVMNKIFYVAKVSGCEFNRPNQHEQIFVAGEITLLKFRFSKGIIDETTIFPDPIEVPAGYRQSLHEDLEDNVGWKPDTFSVNNTQSNTIEEIRRFFGSHIDEPIFVPTQEHMVVVGQALYCLFKEANLPCPWISSFSDWGANTRIYQLEHLVSIIMKKRCTNTDVSVEKDLSVTTVLDYWLHMMMDYAPEVCVRHVQFGLPNQCSTNLLKKYLFMAFVIMKSICGDDMDDLKELVSEQFYENMDFILPSEMINNDEEVTKEPTDAFTSNWTDYYDSSGIEQILQSFDNVSLNGNNQAIPGHGARWREMGRGRGRVQNPEPNLTPEIRKMRLPNVIC